MDNPKNISLNLSAFSIFKSFSKKNYVTILLYLLFTLLAYPLESVILPQFYSYFFETIKKNQSTDTFIKFFLILTTILLVTYSSASLQHYFEAILLPKINAFYIDYLYKNILRKYQNEYTDLDMGSVLAKFTAIPTIMREITSDIAAWILPRVLAIVVINIYFFSIHWKLGLLSLITILVFYFVNKHLLTKCVVYASDRQNELEKKNSETSDKLSNLATIYSAGDIDNEIEKYQSTTLNVMRKHKNSLECVNKNKILNVVFIIALFVILNSYITFLFKKGDISYHTLVALFITIIYYIPCFYSISESVPDVTHYLGVLAHYDSFLNELQKTDLNNQNDKRPDIVITKGNIEIRDLYFDYNGSRPIFNNFNIKINGGTHLALLGPSGNGKSTLVKIIMGYFHVKDNTIFIDNQDINKVNLESLRKEICYVNQNSKLFNMSIYDNISYGNDYSHSEIDDLITKMGVSKIFDGLTKGLNTLAGVDGGNLSGGQKQIIHILRAMAKKNKIVIMDEPTAAIDVYNRELVIHAIQEMSKNKTLILITHDDALLKSCNRVVRIANGKIVSDKSY